MTPRTIAATVAISYLIALLVLDIPHPAALLLGLVIWAGFAAVDGWQARWERADREQVARIVHRERTRR